MSNFTKKIALVTGGASGIGFAVAEKFLTQGNLVIISDINQQKGNDVVKKLSDLGEVYFFQTDVRNNTQVKNLLEHIISTYSKLDIACNCAGSLKPYQTIEDYSEESWDDVIDTNLKGIWLCLKYEIQTMMKTGGAGLSYCK